MPCARCAVDRFDVAEGFYWFLVHHHEGQGSAKYARLCRLGRKFRPGPLARGPQSEDAQAVYRALCVKEGCTHEVETFVLAE